MAMHDACAACMMVGGLRTVYLKRLTTNVSSRVVLVVSHFEEPTVNFEFHIICMRDGFTVYSTTSILRFLFDDSSNHLRFCQVLRAILSRSSSQSSIIILQSSVFSLIPFLYNIRSLLRSSKPHIRKIIILPCLLI
jgi:hypothetical protein